MDRRKYGWGSSSPSCSKAAGGSNISNGVCKALKESGSECKESQSLRIIDEIHQLYADRLQRIDEEAGGDGTQLKLRTLHSWVNDLGEQNAMLVRTVEQLEQEATDRVALLEDSLQRSSRVALEYMTKLQDYDNQLSELAGSKVESETKELKINCQLEIAKKNEEHLHDRVTNLQNDISCLLELIKRARQTGNWDLCGLNFKEVTPEDIFGSCPCQLDKDGQIKKLQNELRELQSKHDSLQAECCRSECTIADLEAEIKRLQDDVVAKDVQIKGFVQRIQELRDSIASKSDQASDLLEFTTRYSYSIAEFSDTAEARRFELESAMWKRRIAESQDELLQARAELRQVESDALRQQAEIMNVTHQLNESERLLQGALHDRNELAMEVNALSAQLRTKTEEIVALTLSLAESEKSAKDMREALTAEVAEKHDQMLALRRDVMQLEEQCRQADMQTHFKDDIIKEMRKDVKLARSKVALLEGVIKSHGYSGEVGPKLLPLNELSYSLPMKSYEQQDRMASSSLPYDSNINSEKIAQVLPYQHVSDNVNFSQSHPCCTHTHGSDTYTAVEKTHRHSNPLRHEKVTRTRIKGVRTHGQLSRVEEALKQELSKMSGQYTNQQHGASREVEVVESNTSTRTIGVQFTQQKQGRMLMDLDGVEAKERRIMELEQELQNVHKHVQKSWDELRRKKSLGGGRSENFNVLKGQLEDMMENLSLRDEKISRQNTMIEELETRLQSVRGDLMQLHDRAEGYLKQMTAAQRSHDESQRRISELKDTLDHARKSMSGSLSKAKVSVDRKEMIKAIDNMKDYQHHADECEATLTAMKGEMDLLMHNLSSREKQIKTLEETISNLQSSLETAKSEMENAHKMAMAYMASHLPDNVDKLDELLNKDQATADALLEAINDLLYALRHEIKMGDPKSSRDISAPRKKTQVSFADGAEDHMEQIRELQRQLKEAQARNQSQTSEVDTKAAPPAAILLAKEIEEFRIKTVEAQAAVEDLKDMIDTLHDNFISQENQVCDLERMMKAVIDTLSSTVKDIDTLQEESKKYEKTDICGQLGDNVSRMERLSNLDGASGEKCNPYNLVLSFNDMKLGMVEQWTRVRTSLDRACLEIKDILEKADDYAQQKEEFETNRRNSEHKIEKLYSELESTQEGLKNTVVELQNSICRD